MRNKVAKQLKQVAKQALTDAEFTSYDEEYHRTRAFENPVTKEVFSYNCVTRSLSDGCIKKLYKQLKKQYKKQYGV